VKVKCKGRTPTNLGEDLGPFEIEKNGSFDNGGKKPDVVVKGKFSADGKKVTGTLEEPAFKDKAKGFDCPAYKTSYSAKLVKGTGALPGDTLAEDDFSDADSGFDTFNSQNSFGEYLDDGRYRLGLRGPGASYSYRDDPVTSFVEVAATVRWYGNDEQDAAGLACQGDGGSFTVGFVRGNGQVELKRYEDGKIAESASPTTLPAGVLKAGQGEPNDLVLTCVPHPEDNTTSVTLEVNGEVAGKARSSSAIEGKTGFFVEDQVGGTDFNFEDYVASVPERS